MQDHRARRWTTAILVSVLFAAAPLRADDPKPDDKPEKKDLTDPTHLLDQVREATGINRVIKKQVPGKEPWRQLIDQPYFTPEVRAEKSLFFGQYADAEQLFNDVLKGSDEKVKPAARIGRLEAILRQGHVADLAHFKEAFAKLPMDAQQSARATMLRAQALLVTGNGAEAQSVLHLWIEKHPDLTADAAVLALYNFFGTVLEQQASYPAAADIYSRVMEVAKQSQPDDAAVRTEIAVAIDRWAVLAGQGHDFHGTAVQRLDKAIEEDDSYWPAHLALAQILLQNHNVEQGGKEVDRVLELNPNCFDAHALGMQYAIEGYNFENAATELAALKTLADTAEVDALEGRLLLKQRVPEQAIPVLEKAVQKDPNLPEARGWLAGAYLLRNQPDKADQQLQAIKPAGAAGHPVVLYEAAEVLRDARQFDAAEKLYRTAAPLAAWWSEPYASLADLYLEKGEEAKATEAKEQAFKIDPYNQRSFNQLTLLGYLDKFTSIETPHFIIRFEEGKDRVVAELAAKWLEKVYPEVTADFGYEPTRKTTIEMFPNHEQFGVRTTGLPWIGTVGACTGNVIAMDVPRPGGGLTGNFDWARVMRHEFTHTVTLGMTDNRIPHWLTEAAACSEEQAPRDWENCQLLTQNYRAGTLFKIQDLNWGFIRPKRSIDRQLAYMQSQWIFEYITETYGHEKILAFLRCFKDGMTEQQAIPAITGGKSLETFNNDFLAWAALQIKSWGLPNDKLPDRESLEKIVAADTAKKDVNARHQLAVVLLSAGQTPRAEKLLREAVAIDPKNQPAREVLGMVLLQNPEKKQEAKDLLLGVLKDNPNRPVTVRTLGLIAMREKDWDTAQQYFLTLQSLRPLEAASYENLAGIYLLKKDLKSAAAQLAELQQHEQSDARIPRKLADIYRQDGQLQQAETMAYKALRINPYSPVNHQLLGQILMDETKPADAIGYFTFATQLSPSVPEYWSDLADAQGQSGDKAGAAASAKHAVDLAPDSPAKKWLAQ